MMRSILLVFLFWAVVVQPVRREAKFSTSRVLCKYLGKKFIEECVKQATDSNPSLEVLEAPKSAAPTSAAPTSSAPTSSAPTSAAPTSAAPTSAAPTSAAPTSAAPTSAAPTSAAPTSAASSANHKYVTKLPEDSLYVINSDIFPLDDQYDSHPYLHMLDPNVLDNILASDETSDLSKTDTVGRNANPLYGNYRSRRIHRNRRTLPRRSSLQAYKKPYSKSLIPPSTEAPLSTLPPVRVTTLPPHVGFTYNGKLFDKTCKPICEYNGQYFPHPVVCDKFYHCAGSIPYERDCPLTTSYDTESGVCQHVYDAINDLCDSARDCSGEGY